MSNEQGGKFLNVEFYVLENVPKIYKALKMVFVPDGTENESNYIEQSIEQKIKTADSKGIKTVDFAIRDLPEDLLIELPESTWGDATKQVLPIIVDSKENKIDIHVTQSAEIEEKMLDAFYFAMKDVRRDYKEKKKSLRKLKEEKEESEIELKNADDIVVLKKQAEKEKEQSKRKAKK